jgi:hypothetical protein
MYLVNTTRHDISVVVSKLSQFVPNLQDDHWCALKRVMHYLKGTMSYDIHNTWHPRLLGGCFDVN